MPGRFITDRQYEDYMKLRTQHMCIANEYWRPSEKAPPFHREVRHLQVVEIVVKNFSKMGCDQGATTPSYWAGRLA